MMRPMKNWIAKNIKYIVSLMTGLILGAAGAFLVLPHVSWYLRRSATVRYILAIGLSVFTAVVVFFVYYLARRWWNRQLASEKTGQRTAIGALRERLPLLTKYGEEERPRRESWSAILVLVAIPVVLAFVNLEWLFTHAGEDDPWRYIGLGYYYFKEPSLLSGSYKISRIAWILIEYAVRNLFTPFTAELILGLGFTILVSIGFYLLVTSFFNSHTAFISTALLSTYTYFMVSRSPDYHNMAGALFFIWSLYFLTQAARSEKFRWELFFLTGSIFGLAVHSELFMLGTFPALIVHFFMLDWGKKRSIWKPVLFSLLGFLTVTGLFGLASALSGRDFFFFMNQLNLVANYSDIFGTRAYGSVDWSWPLQRTHLALPAAAYLFAAGWTVRNLVKFFRSNLQLDRFIWLQTSLNLQFTLLGMIWLIAELFKKEALLRYYYVNPLYIYTFLVFAGFLALGRQARISPFLLGSVSVVVCSALAFSDRIFSAIGLQILPRWQILQPFLFYLVSFACLVLLMRWKIPSLAIVILMSLGNVMGINTGTGGIFITTAQVSLDMRQCQLRQDGYLSVVDTVHTLWNYGWKRTHIWWDETESIPLKNCYGKGINFDSIGKSVTRTGIQIMKASEPALPVIKIPAAYYRQVTRQNDAVSVITNNPATAGQMLTKLRSFGNWALAQHTIISQGDVRFSLYVFTLDGKKP
jgi:hypothetical protein